MDIKDLNKPQLLLLAVLLSFVTSIATGITTVTLMQKAPQSFTAPVNRVIQQTIEKIQQVEGKTTVQTVVVKEEDLVVDAIAKNKSAVFTITKEGQDPDGKSIEIPAGLGFVVSTPGVIVADMTLVPSQQTYFVKNSSGKFKADFIFSDKGGFSFLEIGAAVNGTDKASFTVPTPGDVSKMKIGQKILVLGSGVTSSIYDGDKDLKISVTKSNGGSVVLDLDGNVLGIALSGEAVSFAPITAIKSALKLSESGGDAGATNTAAPVLAPAAQ